MYRVLILLTLAGCGFGGTSSPGTPSPSTGSPAVQPPVVSPPVGEFTIPSGRIGVTVANTADYDSAEMFEEIASTGFGMVRLSAYYREPWALRRTIDEALVAHAVGLDVLVDVQPFPEMVVEPSLEEWSAAFDTLSRELPPEIVLSVGNEANVYFWWPWGGDHAACPYVNEHFLSFWEEARRVTSLHNRELAGPEIAGDWPCAMEWLDWFVENATPPDILAVHTYERGVLEWVEALPWDGRVWITELSLLEGTTQEQEEHIRETLSSMRSLPRWERTILYDWYAHTPYHIRGTSIQNLIERITR